MPTLGNYRRPTKHLPAPSPRQTMAHMTRLARQGQYRQDIRGLTERIVLGLHPNDYLSEYAAVRNWVLRNIRYSRDPRTIEQVKSPEVTIETRTGDCLTVDTKVVVRNSSGRYRIKALSALRGRESEYEALSYNFEQREWEFKPILAWAPKGTQEVHEVHMANGYRFRCTSGHELYLWNQSAGIHEVRTVADACSSNVQDDGSRKLKQGWTLLCARDIPFLNRDASLNDGKPLSGNLVHDHGGLGRNPIWRLYEARGLRYHERMPHLTNVGIHGVRYAGVEEVCDIEVADNHNFLLANGVLVHNCDDMAVVIATMVGQIGGRVRFVAGGFRGARVHHSGRPVLSHVWAEAYDPNSKSWIVLDPVPGRKVHEMLGKVAHREMMMAID